MSEEKKEVCALEALNIDLAHYKAQRDHFSTNLQQCIGAIFATEQAIQKLQDKPKDEGAPVEQEEAAEAEAEA